MFQALSLIRNSYCDQLVLRRLSPFPDCLCLLLPLRVPIAGMQPPTLNGAYYCSWLVPRVAGGGGRRGRYKSGPGPRVRTLSVDRAHWMSSTTRVVVRETDLQV